MRKDYIVNISDYVEDFESDLQYKRLIKIIYCKDCTSEEDAVFFDVEVIELHNDTVIYSY